MTTPVWTTHVDRERRDLDVADQILLLEPDATPLTVVLAKAKKQTAGSAEVIWWEDILDARWTTNTVAALVTDTVITVAANLFQVRDRVQVPATGEMLHVTAINTATNQITVTRAWGATAAAAIPINSWLLLLGQASAESSRAPVERPSQPTKHFNYCQLYRTAFSVSGTHEAEGTRTGQSDRQRLSKKHGVQHLIDIERDILFGERSERVTTGEVRRTMGGLLRFITSNVTVVAGTLTEAILEEFCELVFRFGSTTKLLVCSPRVATVINRMGARRLEIIPRDQVYGLQAREFLSAHGRLILVKSNVLENAYSGHAFCLDIENIAYRPLRDTKLRRNIQPPDEDSLRDEYLTETTLQVSLERTHGILRGVTGGPT